VNSQLYRQRRRRRGKAILYSTPRPIHLSPKSRCSWADAVDAQQVIPRLTRKSQGVNALWRRFLGQDAWHGRARWPRSCIEGRNRNHVGVLVNCAVRTGGREDGLVCPVCAVLMLCIIFPFPFPFPFPFSFRVGSRIEGLTLNRPERG
jgi:hypothetical protein